MRSIIWLILAALLLIILLPLSLVLWIIDKFRSPYAKPLLGTRFATEILVPFMTRLGGCNYTIIGKENLPSDDDAAIYVGNHQGNFDVLLIQFALGIHKVTMTKWEAIYVPVANIWLAVLKCIFVKRKNPRQAKKCMERTIDFVKHGRSVLYFPEGTRSHGPDIGNFKGGAFKTAVSTGAKIVPFVIDGTYKVYEQQGKLKKADVVFSILPPIEVSTEEDPKELSAKTKALIQAELDRIRGKEND